MVAPLELPAGVTALYEVPPLGDTEPLQFKPSGKYPKLMPALALQLPVEGILVVVQIIPKGWFNTPKVKYVRETCNPAVGIPPPELELLDELPEPELLELELELPPPEH